MGAPQDKEIPDVHLPLSWTRPGHMSQSHTCRRGNFFLKHGCAEQGWLLDKRRGVQVAQCPWPWSLGRPHSLHSALRPQRPVQTDLCGPRHLEPTPEVLSPPTWDTPGSHGSGFLAGGPAPTCSSCSGLCVNHRPGMAAPHRASPWGQRLWTPGRLRLRLATENGSRDPAPEHMAPPELPLLT